MRVIEIRNGHEEEDIKAGRDVILNEIARLSTNVMIIRGTSAEIGQFADLADIRSEPFPYRQVIWVKNDAAILTGDQKNSWFGGHNESCAVILDFQDSPIAWLTSDATLYDIENAFLVSQGGVTT